MAIGHLVTRGYGTGTLAGDVNLIVVRGYTAGEAIAVVEEQRGGGSKGRKREDRKRHGPVEHYVDPERARIYARAGTDLLPPRPVEQPAAQPIEPPAELAPKRIAKQIRDLERAGDEAAAAIAAEQAVLAHLEAQEAERARTRLAQLEQEALLAYLMVA